LEFGDAALFPVNPILLLPVKTSAMAEVKLRTPEEAGK
jgi:hypothetical protein